MSLSVCLSSHCLVLNCFSINIQKNTYPLYCFHVKRWLRNIFVVKSNQIEDASKFMLTISELNCAVPNHILFNTFFIVSFSRYFLFWVPMASLKYPWFNNSLPVCLTQPPSSFSKVSLSSVSVRTALFWSVSSIQPVIRIALSVKALWKIKMSQNER